MVSATSSLRNCFDYGTESIFSYATIHTKEKKTYRLISPGSTEDSEESIETVIKDLVESCHPFSKIKVDSFVKSKQSLSRTKSYEKTNPKPFFFWLKKE
jgi:hypothetical protein